MPAELQPETTMNPQMEQPVVRKKRALTPIIVVLAVLALGWQVVRTSTSEGAGMYNLTLAQVLDRQAGQLEGREIKVVGTVKAGSVTGQPAGADFRFEIEDKQGHVLKVAYPKLLPDPFEEGREAIVAGKLAHGELQATSLTVKCPSRYGDAESMSAEERERYYRTEFQKHKQAMEPR